MNKIALYPFDATLLPIVRHFNELQTKYQLNKVISFPGSGLAGHDAAYACNQTEIGVMVSQFCDESEMDWDTLYVVAKHLPYGFESEEVLKNVLALGKQIIYLESCKKRCPLWVRKLQEENDSFHVQFSESLLPSTYGISRYEMIKTPVILVGGLIMPGDVSEVTLALTAELKKAGLSTAVLTNDPIGSLFGFYDLTSQYADGLNVADSIMRINWQIQAIEKELVPDVIVMEAPDSMMRYNSIVPNGFGILTYMLCQAARPDYCICSMPSDLVGNELIQMLSMDFKVRYGIGINAVHVSNMLVDGVDSLQKRKVLPFFADSLIVDEAIQFEKNFSVPVFNVISQRDELQKIVKNVIV